MSDQRIPKYTGPDSIGRRTLMTREEIKARFDAETASLYSQKDPAWLPEFAYAFGLISDLVRPFLSGTNRVLDIGAGTGNLSRTILEASELAHMHLLDFSQNMLDEAPKVLGKYAGRFTVTNADFMNQPFGSCDYCCVVSSFAIHHCRGDEEYGSLYEKIYGSLVSPGIFVCCDVVSGDNPFLAEFNEKGWSSFLTDQGFTIQEIGKILSNYHTEDTPVSMSTHMRLLSKAGFAHTDVIWKKANFALYVGIKNTAR
jgi:tRNA (cmo5U34)-methyltransferase